MLYTTQIVLELTVSVWFGYVNIEDGTVRFLLVRRINQKYIFWKKLEIFGLKNVVLNVDIMCLGYWLILNINFTEHKTKNCLFYCLLM